ncbi:nuclear protein localization protein 4 [Microbotryomycetes sp. JL221]|nr:nuclear protein localization protein 4 [Microbotryomycetes sp. JL221]
MPSSNPNAQLHHTRPYSNDETHDQHATLSHDYAHDYILETSPLIDPQTLALSNAPRGGENLVTGITGSLASLGIKHGDLLFASYTPLAEPSTSTTSTAATTTNMTPAIANATTVSGQLVPDDPPMASTSSTTKSDPTTTSTSSSTKTRPWQHVKQDQVDEYWDKQDGKIQRPKGKDGCRCGPKSMCDYCMPLEPFDAQYQSSHGIKHLSYHAHLRKLNASAPLSTQTSTSTWIPPLSTPDYKVKVPCPSQTHPNWPNGICTKCQPSAVTLTRQSFRMIDHVEFVEPKLIENLLTFWRQTGTQRFGFLLGHYEPFPDVPMGIKAVVEAIHEVAQEGHADGVTVGTPWTHELERIQRLATQCHSNAKTKGLDIVGMIYTDLTQDTSTEINKNSGKVLTKRHANSFFLSSLEIVFSATLQQKFPAVSKYSDNGKFSSRFVTCVVSGDLDGNIAVEAYQVSDQAMAMVEADMIEPSVEPGTMRVKEQAPTRYIPDVFYRYKNKYNLDVKESAKPCFPVEYLLVNVTHGFPNIPNPMFVSTLPFSIENRPGLQDQTISLISSNFNQITLGLSKEILKGQNLNHLNQDKGKSKQDEIDGLSKIVTWLSDWHLLAFLDELGIFDKNDMSLLCRIGSNKDLTDLFKLFSSPNWQTFLTILDEQAPTLPTRDYPSNTTTTTTNQTHFDDGFEIPPDVDVPPDTDIDMNNNGGIVGMDNNVTGGVEQGGGTEGEEIACPHCTFLNNSNSQECELCGLPLRP